MPRKTSNAYLFLLSFIEGGSVMSCELIGAKLLAPYFGTSLYVWAAVLALTLGGLTLGYFLGGKLSRKYIGKVEVLYIVLIAAGFFLTLMPFLSQTVMNVTINLSLEIGAITSLIGFLIVPLMFMGMVSPLIINLLTDDAGNAGNNAGTVYAISTLGGILFTFMMGFYIIPNFGLTKPAILSGLLLAILPLISLLKTRAARSIISFVLILVASLLSLNATEKFNEDYKILYQSEGILGQVKVVDHPSYEFTSDNRIGRALIVNNTLQTYIGIEDNFQYSIWNWAQYFPTAASIYPEKSKVLLLGLGGGTIVKQLNRLNYEVDVVEIDQRIWEVSVEFFGLDPNTNIIIDDARHYIKTSKKKYDIIIFDTFLSESVPEHLLTLEGIADAKNILEPDGMIMSNFYGYFKGERGRAARSVYKTYVESELDVEILATPGDESSRNLIFLASRNPKDFTNAKYSEPNYPELENIYDYFIDRRFIDTDDVKSLSDHQPRLSKLYNPAAREWKKNYNSYYRKYFKSETK